MLQIIIIHEPNSVHISEIRDLENLTSLATYDENKKATDLSCLESHIDEVILVSHFVRNNDCTRLDYEQERTLTAVGTDENGFMYLQYN
jgi:hypothetical protein